MTLVVVPRRSPVVVRLGAGEQAAAAEVLALARLAHGRLDRIVVTDVP